MCAAADTFICRRNFSSQIASSSSLAADALLSFSKGGQIMKNYLLSSDPSVLSYFYLAFEKVAKLHGGEFHKHKDIILRDKMIKICFHFE